MSDWPTPGPDPSWSDVFAAIGGALRDRARRWRQQRRWRRYQRNMPPC